MDILLMMFIVIIIAAVVLQILLHKDKTGSNIIFLLNIALVILVSFITFTGLPTNYRTPRYIAIGWSVVALLAFILKGKGSLNTSKILLTIAKLGSIIQMFI